MNEYDYMEIGDSGLVSMGDGWYFDQLTGNKIDPTGKVFDKAGDVIWDPDLEEEYER